MKSILTGIGAFFMAAVTIGQSADFPMLSDAYGDQKINELMEEQSRESLLKLEAFAQMGLTISDSKGNTDMEVIAVPLNELDQFNPLKYDLSAESDSHSYYLIEGTNQVVIVFSTARQEVLYQRFLTKFNNAK